MWVTSSPDGQSAVQMVTVLVSTASAYWAITIQGMTHPFVWNNVGFTWSSMTASDGAPIGLKASALSRPVGVYAVDIRERHASSLETIPDSQHWLHSVYACYIGCEYDRRLSTERHRFSPGYEPVR
jgi:hypothetical protein